MNTTTTDCGRAYEHGTHAYTTPRGKVKACDGSLDKRLERK